MTEQQSRVAAHRGILVVAFAAIAITGCGQSPEDRIYEAFKCGKAAALLERDEEARRAMDTIEPLAANLVEGANMARYAMELGQRFQEEVPLYQLSAGDQLTALQEIYQSDDCQAMYVPTALNLGDATIETTEGQEPAGKQDALPQVQGAAQSEEVAGLMRVAKLLGTQHGGDPFAVAQLCEQHASSFADASEVQQCKALGGPVALAPVPKTADEAFSIAATLPAKARFEFCTSGQVRTLFRDNNDHERCFPPEAQQEAERTGGINEQGQVPVQVSQEAIQEQIIANAAGMSQSERQAYCYVQSVLVEFDNDPAQCLTGERVLTDDDPGYRDDGH